jgi:uncharacterized protein
MPSIKHPFLPFFLCLLLLFSCSSHSGKEFSVAKIPDPMLHGHYVSNPHQLISPAAEQALNLLLDSLDRSGRAQVAVVLLKTIGNKVPKDVAHEIFRTWRPGDREKNNGLVVLLVNDQRRIEFETGYGLEGDLPDVVCFRIQQHIMLPYFKQQDYDNGMLQGLQAVVTVLRGEDVQTAAAPEDNAANAFMEPEPPARKTPGEASTILYLVLLVLGNIGFFALRVKKKSPANSSLPAASSPVRPGWMAWAWLFIMPFVVIFCLMNFTSLSFGIFTVALIIYTAWILFWCYYIAAISRNAAHASRDANRYNSYLTWKSTQLHLLLAILFPLPILLFSRWLSRRLYQLRSAPYPCDTCGKPMHRLSEKDDDVYLEKYQAVEEKIRSVDYDVWRCADCSALKILAYDNNASDATACPECRHKTLIPTIQEEQQAATTSSQGWGWQHYACDFCNFKKKETYTIPVISSGSGSSSSGSSGSSSSSGSWGGGSSGGGGAGSSW